jgi:hypothetical protein
MEKGKIGKAYALLFFYLLFFPLIFIISCDFSNCVCVLSALSSSCSPHLFFQDYISKMDPAATLGLSTESIHGYSLSHVKRVLDAEPPEVSPCCRGVSNISVSLKGQSFVSWGEVV